MPAWAWLTIGLIALSGLALVVAAFADRRRGREIARDLRDQADRQRGPDREGPR